MTEYENRPPLAGFSQSASSGDSPYAGQQLLLLGISGVLHPSQSLYELVIGRSPWDDGHERYEATPWLADTLAGWPSVRIVLTSARAWKPGMEQTLWELGPELAFRVVGSTYADLTTRILRTRQGKTGPLVRPRFSDDDYWRMNKSRIVQEHVAWARPAAWVVLDDEDILWRPADREHLVIVDGCLGLLDTNAQEAALAAFEKNFGPPVQPEAF